jgi:hypothetical protein
MIKRSARLRQDAPAGQRVELFFDIRYSLFGLPAMPSSGL